MSENMDRKLDMEVSKKDVWVLFGLLMILLIGLTISLVAFTPLRNYIPGYARPDIVELAYQNQSQIDSLTVIIEEQLLMNHLIRQAISGKISVEESQKIKDSVIAKKSPTYTHSLYDSILRKQIEEADRYTVSTTILQSNDMDLIKSKFSLAFYQPLQGRLLQEFDRMKSHYGIDIEGNMNDVIKACHDGDVIYTDWSPEWNYIMILQHSDNLVSIYASNSTLLKKKGDFVKAGEAIGIIGSCQEAPQTSMLHFELWYDGNPINPKDYLVF